jgi:hypothetical protein
LILWLLHEQRSIELVGVVANGGGQPEARARLAYCILDKLGAEIPVGIGSQGMPYEAQPHEYALDGCAQVSRDSLHQGKALIARALMQSKRKSLTVVLISSLREFADAIAELPELVEDKVVAVGIMGGLVKDASKPSGYAPDTSVNNMFDMAAAEHVYDWCFAKGIRMAVVSRFAVPMLPMQLAKRCARASKPASSASAHALGSRAAICRACAVAHSHVGVRPPAPQLCRANALSGHALPRRRAISRACRAVGQAVRGQAARPLRQALVLRHLLRRAGLRVQSPRAHDGAQRRDGHPAVSQRVRAQRPACARRGQLGGMCTHAASRAVHASPNPPLTRVRLAPAPDRGRFVKPYDLIALLAVLPRTRHLFADLRAEVSVPTELGEPVTHTLLLEPDHALDVAQVQRLLRETYHAVALATAAQRGRSRGGPSSGSMGRTSPTSPAKKRGRTTEPFAPIDAVAAAADERLRIIAVESHLGTWHYRRSSSYANLTMRDPDGVLAYGGACELLTTAKRLAEKQTAFEMRVLMGAGCALLVSSSMVMTGSLLLSDSEVNDNVVSIGRKFAGFTASLAFCLLAVAAQATRRSHSCAVRAMAAVCATVSVVLLLPCIAYVLLYAGLPSPVRNPPIVGGLRSAASDYAMSVVFAIIGLVLLRAGVPLVIGLARQVGQAELVDRTWAGVPLLMSALLLYYVVVAVACIPRQCHRYAAQGELPSLWVLIFLFAGLNWLVWRRSARRRLRAELGRNLAQLSRRGRGCGCVSRHGSTAALHLDPTSALAPLLGAGESTELEPRMTAIDAALCFRPEPCTLAAIDAIPFDGRCEALRGGDVRAAAVVDRGHILKSVARAIGLLLASFLKTATTAAIRPAGPGDETRRPRGESRWSTSSSTRSHAPGEALVNDGREDDEATPRRLDVAHVGGKGSNSSARGSGISRAAQLVGASIRATPTITRPVGSAALSADTLTAKQREDQCADYYVVHSHEDDPEAKRRALRDWAELRMAANGSVPPTVWLDELCADVSLTAEQLLAYLPFYLGRCRKLLVLVGRGFPGSLMTALELFCWVETGGSIANVEVLMVAPGGAAHEEAVAAIDAFHAMYTSVGTGKVDERIIRALELAPISTFNEHVRSFLPAVERAVAGHD